MKARAIRLPLLGMVVMDVAINLSFIAHSWVVETTLKICYIDKIYFFSILRSKAWQLDC